MSIWMGISGEYGMHPVHGDLELYTGEPIDDYGLDMHLSMGELTLNGSEQRPVMTSPGGPHSLKVTSDMGDVRVEFGG